MPRDRLNNTRLSFEERAPQTRACDVPGCAADGCFRAPRARDRLNDYWWFCLDHVREYKSRWDYYAGMSESDIERELRQAMLAAQIEQIPLYPEARACRRPTTEHILRLFSLAELGAKAGGPPIVEDAYITSTMASWPRPPRSHREPCAASARGASKRQAGPPSSATCSGSSPSPSAMAPATTG
jgi:hypothetical protein